MRDTIDTTNITETQKSDYDLRLEEVCRTIS